MWTEDQVNRMVRSDAGRRRFAAWLAAGSRLSADQLVAELELGARLRADEEVAVAMSRIDALDTISGELPIYAASEHRRLPPAI